MQINLAAATGSRLSRIPWRKFLVIAVFLVTLAFTIGIAELVIGLVRPAAADDPVALRTMLSEISSVSSSVDADLAALGFTKDGNSSGLRSAGALTPTIATQPPVITSTTALTPIATSTSTPVLPAWDRKGRVNILLMGLDGKASQGRFRRADSIIVASIDPATNSAVLIGIPRDLYVTINSPKGQLRNRINTAYVWGELYNYPGGGPALQMRTVGEVLGIPIHNYVSVYFDGFSKLIDAIGGIDINVPTAIKDNYMGYSFSAGMQHMDGKRALQYARSRYSTSDFSRGRRQQQVVLAAVERMAKANILAKLPAILPTVTDAFRSDMSIPELLSLASLGYKIDRSTIKTAQVDETMCQSWWTPDGAAVLLPKFDRIKPMVTAALLPAAPVALTPSPVATTPAPATGSASTAATPVPTQSATVAPAYRSEQARIEILNGTNTIGLARRTQTWFEGQGLQVVRIADATGIYNQTMLYSDGTKPATRDALVRLLNIQPQNIKALSAGGVNLRVVLGKDAKVP